VKDIDDIASMQRQTDGTFAVICSDGRHEVATAQQIRLGQVCVNGGPGSGRVYCKQANTAGVFSPARTANGAWLDDSPGTELSACSRQVSRARTSLYCRQLKNSPQLFSPARVSDGGWVDNAPGTSLDVCLQQI